MNLQQESEIPRKSPHRGGGPSLRKKRNKFHAILLIILLFFTSFLVLEFIAVFFIPPQESQITAYPDEDGWNDISFFSDWVRSEPNYELSNICFSPTALYSVKNADNSIFLIIGPERKYSSDEVDAISDFIERGGSMIVADDSSNANALHDKAAKDSPLKKSFRFHGDALLSMDFTKNPKLVKFEAASPGLPEEERYYSLLFNEGTALEDGPEENEKEEALAISSKDSWLDTNKNEQYDYDDEDMKEYDLIDMVNFEKSAGIYISDSSIFINDMWVRVDNSLFIKDSVKALIGNNGTIIIDESVHKDSSFVGNTITFAVGTLSYLCNSMIFIVVFIVMLIALAVVLFIRSKKVLRKPHRLEAPTPILLELRNPDLLFSDMYRLRAIIFDLLSIEHDLSHTYFYRHPEMMTRLIGDDMINQFLYDPYLYEERYLDEIVKRCETRWIEGDGFIRSDRSITDNGILVDEYLPEIYAEVFPLEEEGDGGISFDAYDGSISARDRFYDPVGLREPSGYGQKCEPRRNVEVRTFDDVSGIAAEKTDSAEYWDNKTMDRDGKLEMNHPQMSLWVSSSETQESASPSPPPPNGGGPRRGFLRMDDIGDLQVEQRSTREIEYAENASIEKGKGDTTSIPNLVDELFPTLDR